MGIFLSLNGILSRIQFAFTAAFHFLFVPLTVGLALLIAIMETFHYKTKDKDWKRLSEFFSNVFIINYAFGIVTGIAMSIQFGTNWSAYATYMGDIFGSPLAFEALTAFFLESTMAGIWFFRRDRLKAGNRVAVTWLIAIGTLISSIWIIVANGFMQNPVGYIDMGDHVKLASFAKLMFNPYAWYMFFHNLTSNILLGGFVVVAVSSYHLLKGDPTNSEMFRKAIRLGSIALLICAILMPIIGNSYMIFISTIQPDKIDMIVGDTSPVVRGAFVTMVSLGTVFIILGIYLVFWHNKFMESPTIQKIMMYTVPLPYIAIITGWMVTEMGRQPWIVYNLLTVEEAISDVPTAEIVFSLAALIVFYGVLFVLDYKVTMANIKKGPEQLKTSEVSE